MVQEFIGQWDDEGVFVYQAFNREIADWALMHQKFGGPNFNPTRMTWFKPSLAWMQDTVANPISKKSQNQIIA